MDIGVMERFLSEGNIKRHCEHLRTLRLRLSIIQKTTPAVIGKGIKEIFYTQTDKRTKEEYSSLLGLIRSHELFFDSFTLNNDKCDFIKKYYSSKDKFIYEIYLAAMDNSHGFLYVYLDRQGMPRIMFSNDAVHTFLRLEPLLALDLYEHTYFCDYGFRKDEFLKNCLYYLDISRLDKKG